MKTTKEIPDRYALKVGMVFINNYTKNMLTIESIDMVDEELTFRRNKDNTLIKRPISHFHRTMSTLDWSYVVSIAKTEEVVLRHCFHVNVVNESYFSGNKYKWCKDCGAALK